MIRALQVMVVCVLVLIAAATAAPVDQWFEAANRFYQNKQYDSAAVFYQKIVDAGVHNSAVFYNLGNTSYRQRQLGKAIVWYERARQLAPTDTDIITNLDFARAMIVDRIEQPQQGLLEQFFVALHRLVPLGTQLWLLLGLLFALSICISAMFYVSHNSRLWLIYVSVCLVVLLGGGALSAGIKIYLQETVTRAVVMQSRVDGRNQPDGETVRFSVHEGTTVRIHKRSKGWVLVSLANGFSAWMPLQALQII
jgi:tetratricopeptide (TPR) repeat protein